MGNPEIVARFSTRKRMFQIARSHDITLKAMILGALKDKYPSLRHRGRRPGRQAPPSLREDQCQS
jgi:hypothetical protein